MNGKRATLSPLEEIQWLRELNTMLHASGTIAAIREAVHFAPLGSVAVVSDYGGEHQGSEYRTYSFLLAAFEALQRRGQAFIFESQSAKLSSPWPDLYGSSTGALCTTSPVAGTLARTSS